VAAAAAAVPATGAAGEPRIFATWDIFEADKCASIWLIKRFIDPEAQIRLVPKGETIEGAIPFDTPEARLRRYHNASTFETLLHHYQLKNPRLRYLGEIIHDIEINTWQRKRMKESRLVIDRIQAIMEESGSGAEIIERSMTYFDELYASLPH
jgi:hypothetical protein